MMVQRVVAPGSKLAMSRAFSQSTLASELSIEGADEDELYATLDWLLARQQRIERALARRHLAGATLVLYDVSSSYFEGRSCPLAQLGYSRDGRRGTLQIIYGLVCAADGCPVAVEVFEGALHDDKTLPAQIDKLKACRRRPPPPQRAERRSRQASRGGYVGVQQPSEPLRSG